MYYADYYREETKTEYSNRKRRNNKRNYKTLTEDIIRTCKEYGKMNERTLKVNCSNCPLCLDKDDNICLVGEILYNLSEDELVYMNEEDEEEHTTLTENINKEIKRTEFLILSCDDEKELENLNSNLNLYKRVRDLIDKEK